MVTRFFKFTFCMMLSVDYQRLRFFYIIITMMTVVMIIIIISKPLMTTTMTMKMEVMMTKQ